MDEYIFFILTYIEFKRTQGEYLPEFPKNTKNARHQQKKRTVHTKTTPGQHTQFQTSAR